MSSGGWWYGEWVGEIRYWMKGLVVMGWVETWGQETGVKHMMGAVRHHCMIIAVSGHCPHHTRP